MHVQSVQNYCFSLSNMQICDVLVAVVDVVALSSLIRILRRKNNHAARAARILEHFLAYSSKQQCERMKNVMFRLQREPATVNLFVLIPYC